MAKNETTTRSYTVSLCNPELGEKAWKALADTHISMAKGTKACANMLLDMTAGMSPKTIENLGLCNTASVRNARRMLTLTWFNVESQDGSPQEFVIAREQLSEKLRGHLSSAGLSSEEIDEWLMDCEDVFSTATRDDSCWVDRRSSFEAMQTRLGIAIHQEDIEDFCFGQFAILGSISDYLSIPELDGLQNNGFSDEPSKIQAAGKMLSSRLGTGKGNDTGALAEAYELIHRALATLPEGEHCPKSDFRRAIELELDDAMPETSFEEFITAKTKGTGRPTATAMRLEAALACEHAIPWSQIEALIAKSADDAQKQRSKIGLKGRRPYFDALIADLEKSTGIAYPIEGNQTPARNWYSCLLDHAARGVSAHHTWIKRAESTRNASNSNKEKFEALPESARLFLRSYEEKRGEYLNAIEPYIIRKKALSGWTKELVKQLHKACDQESRIAILKEAQSISDMGDMTLFMDMMSDEAFCAWHDASGKPTHEILATWAEHQELEQKRLHFKTPAYRHPDPSLHPVFADFGKSRPEASYTFGQELHQRSVTLMLVDGNAFSRFSFHWHSKRLMNDFDFGATNKENKIAICPMTTRFANALDEECRPAVIFEKNLRSNAIPDIGTRLQAKRTDLERHAINGTIDDPEKVGWFLSLSLQIKPASLSTKALTAQTDERRKEDRARKSAPSKLRYSRIPDLTIIGVDLGHRKAASCSVWKTCTYEEIADLCSEANRAIPDNNTLHLILDHPDRRIKARRISSDILPSGEASPAPWAILQREFAIELPGAQEKEQSVASKNELAFHADPYAESQRFAHTPTIGTHRRTVAHVQHATVEKIRRDIKQHAAMASLIYLIRSKNATKPGGAQISLTDEELLSSVEKRIDKELNSRYAEPAKWMKDLPYSNDPSACARILCDIDNGYLAGLEKQWEENDARIRRAVKTLRRWVFKGIEPCSEDKKARKGAGGLSLSRIATMQATYQLVRSFSMRPMPHDIRRGIAMAEQGELADLGKYMTDQIDRMREQLAKHVASRIMEAALGLGGSQTAREKRNASNFDERFRPCDLIVIENLANYRPEQTRSRAENRRIMQWASARVAQYLKDECDLYGIALYETPAAYTSRQDSRTGLPGFRFKEIPVEKLFAGEGSRGISLEYLLASECENERRFYSELKKRWNESENTWDEPLCEERTIWKMESGSWVSKNGMPLKKGANPRPIPVIANGAELFMATEDYGTQKIQADINAAGNIALRAVFDPDWAGSWWRINVQAKSGAIEKKHLGSLAFEEKTIRPEGEAPSDGIIGAWSTVSAQPLNDKTKSWTTYKTYWDEQRNKVFARLCRQYGIPPATSEE